jgi:hypothetical protein
MGIIDTLKETASLLQKVDNIDLYRKMLELQTQVFALVEENRALKEQLAVRGELRYERNAYWRKDDGPFCAPCWDKDAKLIRVPGDLYLGSRRCPICHNPAG